MGRRLPVCAVITFALVVAVGTLGAGMLGALIVRALPTVRLQIAALGLLATVLPLAVVVVSGLVMFDSQHDLVILAVAAASSTVAVTAGLAVAGRLGDGVRELSRAAAAVAAGDLGARANPSRPHELEELASSFNDMAQRLEDLFDARTELVAWASHDLRTPLASMQAMLEALEDGLAEPEQYLPALRDQVRRLSALVDDLFELARIDAGVLTLELRNARLRPLVDDCLRTLEAEAAARKIRLSGLVGDGIEARCAPAQVERVLYNLLTNALRHTPTDGTVAVRADADDGEVHVSVEDSGTGLDPSVARRAFEYFWRGDAARSSSAGGAGLGLAIARGLVEAHGGRIWAEPSPSGGARVCFTLPAA